jgi:hypothetical protein
MRTSNLALLELLKDFISVHFFPQTPSNANDDKSALVQR